MEVVRDKAWYEKEIREFAEMTKDNKSGDEGPHVEAARKKYYEITNGTVSFDDFVSLSHQAVKIDKMATEEIEGKITPIAGARILFNLKSQVAFSRANRRTAKSIII